MRVLITTDAYHTMINGVAVSVNMLYEGLKEAGHDVRILTLSQTKNSYRKGEVYEVGSREFRIYPDVRVACSMSEEILQHICDWSPEVRHSQSEFSTFVFAKKIARKLGIPIVHTYHTLYESYTHYFCPSKNVGRWIVSIASRWICNQAQVVIAPTRKIEEILSGYGVNTEIQIVPTGLQLEKFRTMQSVQSEMRKKLGIPQEAKVLVFLGRVACEKKIDFLIRQMIDKEMYLVIVGDGPQKKQLEALTERLGVGEKVFFTGPVQPAEVPRYYQVGDVFVSASESETQGLTYVEAMASGLPLLCKKDKCLEQVLFEGENGYFFEDERSFAEKLERLFSEEGEISSLQEKARKTANRFSKETFAKKAAEVYKIAMKEKGGEICIPFECIPKQIWRKVTGY